MLFHSFEPTLAIADDQVISIFNWQTLTRTHAFSDDNPKGSRVTSLQFINEEDTSLLVAASDDGHIRLYRKYDEPEVELVSAWRAASDIQPGSRGTGVVCRWQQSCGYLFTGGDSRVVRIWDAEDEICAQEIQTNSTSQVTDLATDPTGTTILAGFTDGGVRMYDRRMPNGECLTGNFFESTGRVLQLSFTNNHCNEFLVGSAGGDILLWDIRQHARTLRLGSGIFDGELNGFAYHPLASVIACASHSQNVRTMNMMGRPLGSIKCGEGFLNRQPATVQSMLFHPRFPLLAVNTASAVSLFRSEAHGGSF
eukprot:jgi/Hompol1/1193/HPOL_002661-RA